MAVFTRGEFAIDFATFLAEEKDGAPLTLTSINLEAPSPSLTT